MSGGSDRGDEFSPALVIILERGEEPSGVEYVVSRVRRRACDSTPDRSELRGEHARVVRVEWALGDDVPYPSGNAERDLRTMLSHQERRKAEQFPLKL